MDQGTLDLFGDDTATHAPTPARVIPSTPAKVPGAAAAELPPIPAGWRNQALGEMFDSRKKYLSGLSDEAVEEIAQAAWTYAVERSISLSQRRSSGHQDLAGHRKLADRFNAALSILDQHAVAGHSIPYDQVPIAPSDTEHVHEHDQAVDDDAEDESADRPRF